MLTEQEKRRKACGITKDELDSGKRIELFRSIRSGLFDASRKLADAKNRSDVSNSDKQVFSEAEQLVDQARKVLTRAQ